MRSKRPITLKPQDTALLEQGREPILIGRDGLLEGIARGERAIEEGRTATHAWARQRMARWLK
ncbi:type II toxin-antitoxin system prevent-host-death family antitoxin [Solimonas sp. K1W22B-7]|uniref:type II toxin-antitoxin system prevent-host-death family antitoxin n=1 Tax=Solimonas sp. K1W22B-7 TaxID=2303331 RepID=UPI000E33362E|nr:type II toxin-antitoxin system prevent-host-death family antitoxin [Solimonas sp. K1W22B-7]